MTFDESASRDSLRPAVTGGSHVSSLFERVDACVDRNSLQQRGWNKNFKMSISITHLTFGPVLHEQSRSQSQSQLVSVSPRLLNLSLTSDLVPEQDVIDVIIHVGRNPQGRNLAWKYFREKWDVLNAR